MNQCYVECHCNLKRMKYCTFYEKKENQKIINFIDCKWCDGLRCSHKQACIEAIKDEIEIYNWFPYGNDKLFNTRVNND